MADWPFSLPVRSGALVEASVSGGIWLVHHYHHHLRRDLLEVPSNADSIHAGRALGMKYERSRSGVLLRDVPSLVREVHAFHRDHRAGLDLVRAAGREAQAQVRSVTVKRNIGRRISKAGLAVILLPDPFSDVIGLPMVMLGELINRAYSSLTLTDVMKEVRSTMEALSEAQWISRLK